MIARNPKTGAPIRIMTSKSSIWRDQKTMAWLETVEALATPRLSRWQLGVVGLEMAKAAQKGGLQPQILLSIDDNTEALKGWLETGASKEYMMICFPRATIQEIGVEVFQNYKLRNLVCLEELHLVYPFVGSQWVDGAIDDAKLLIAMVLHMGRVMPMSLPAEGPRTQLAVNFGIRFESELQTPPPLWLVTQYYVPDQSKRRREIQACLKANIDCPLVDRVILLNEKSIPTQLDGKGKVTEEVIGKRLTYADVLRWICENTSDEVESNPIIAFANADIFFEKEGIDLLWSVDMTNKFLALLRWEVEGTDPDSISKATLFGPRADSQDTWIVSAASVRAAFKDCKSWTPFEIPFGKAGCDNAITMEMLRMKFHVTNPAVNIRTYHYHKSQVRTYDPKDIVDRPAYLYIEPTGVHDMTPITNLEASKITPLKGSGFSRPVKGPLSEKQAATFCTMLERASGGAFKLSPKGENRWEPPVVPLYRAGSAFQNREGLPYGYNSILVGPTKAASDAWSKAKLGVLASSLEVEHSFAVPLADSVAVAPGPFCTKYLSKIFLMKKVLGVPAEKDVEFWCHKRPGTGADALRLFHWGNREELPAISRDEVAQVWSKETVAWLPQDLEADLIRREEVDALREAMGLGKGWSDAIEVVDEMRRLVIICDEKYVTDEVAEAIEKEVEGVGFVVKMVWAGRTNLEAIVKSLRGAWGCIVATGETASWIWALPRGATVWEVQSEMAPSGEGLHMAAAAELEHRLAIVPKGALTAADRATLVEKLAHSVLEELECETDSGNGSSETGIPTLHLPTGHTGRFAHAGDSFREMCRLWAERGYVKLVEDPAATQVWLGGVGKHLLYDRPTLEWLVAAPRCEQTWSGAALFGNPAVPDGAPQASSWFFWPRRPALVEGLVAEGIGKTAWENRQQTLVFYGRSENAVQRSRRTAEDWSAACSEFVHVEGLQPYPFTQEEYLRRLAGARFGLCLAGYGLKCHREIECMAMGCVPIVAPEVDMTNYAMPPREGVHYFRAATPEEAKRIATTTTEDRWMKMSAAARFWWEQNASAAGSWALTKNLLAEAEKV